MFLCQGESLLGGSPASGISRFQAVAVGEDIYIHTHRNSSDIYVLHTAASPPVLEKVPVAGPGPSSRGLHSVVAVGRALYLYGGAPQQGPMVRREGLSGGGLEGSVKDTGGGLQKRGCLCFVIAYRASALPTPMLILPASASEYADHSLH
jgi:hypothetical protein